MEPNENTINDCDYVNSNQDTTNDCDLYLKSGQDTNNDVVLNTHSDKDTTNDCVLNGNCNQNTNNGILKSLGPNNHASESTLSVNMSVSTFDAVSPDLLIDHVRHDEDKLRPLCESNTKHLLEQSANSAINPELLIHSIDDEDDEDDEDSFPSSDNSVVEDIESVAPDNEKTEPAERLGSPSFYIYMLAAYKPEDLEQHLSRGGDINTADSFGVTPIMYAQKYNHRIVIKRLIELGAKFPKEEEKIVIDESFMFRQIFGAAQSIEEPSLVILVCQVLGCPVDIRNEARETPLMVAVRESNINAIQNLLNAGACIDDDVLLAACDQSMFKLLKTKKEELATRDVGCENCVSSVDPICHTSSQPLQSSTESTTSINEANQDFLLSRTDSNEVDNNETENAVEDTTCNIQQQDAYNLTDIRDTSEIQNIQHVFLESQSELLNIENIFQESPSETRTIENISLERPSETINVENISQEIPSEKRNVENISLESPLEIRNIENISLDSPSERRHVENVSQGSQIETGNIPILSQDDAREIRITESEPDHSDVYHRKFNDQLESTDLLKSHENDRDSTAELSSRSSSQSNIEPEMPTLSASNDVGNSCLKHLATESKSESTNIQTTGEKNSGNMET